MNITEFRDSQTAPQSDPAPETDKIAALEKELANTRGQIEALSRQPAAPPPPAEPVKETKKHYSREELSQAVYQGTITQAQSDQIWEAQLEEKLLSQVETKLTDHSRTTEDLAAIDRYKDADPALADQTSPTFRRVAQEYRNLVANGQPESHATELLALKIVKGATPHLRARTPRRTFADQPARSGGGAAPNADSRQGLSDKQRRHYQNAIQRGIYKDWNEVQAELRGYKKRRAQ